MILDEFNVIEPSSAGVELITTKKWVDKQGEEKSSSKTTYHAHTMDAIRYYIYKADYDVSSVEEYFNAIVAKVDQLEKLLK